MTQLRHADAVSGRVRENEYEHVSEHILNSQATGMLVRAESATQLSGLAIGADNYILSVATNTPAWISPATLLADVSPLTTRGDIMYRNATISTRLAKGAANTVLVMGANEPAWSATLAGLTLTSPTINGTIATTGLTLPAVTLAGAVAGGDQAFTGVGDMTFTDGSIIAAIDGAGTTLLFKSGGLSGTTFITLTSQSGGTDTMILGKTFFYDAGGEYIESNGSNLTIAGGVIFPGTLYLYDAGGESLSSNGSVLTIAGAVTFSGSAIITADSATIEIGAAGVIKSGSTNGDTLLIAANDTTFITLTTNATDVCTMNAITASGTWLASGTWTIPAVTLGGTVSGGNQNIGNIGRAAFGNTAINNNMFLYLDASETVTDNATKYGVLFDIEGVKTSAAYTGVFQNRIYSRVGAANTQNWTNDAPWGLAGFIVAVLLTGSNAYTVTSAVGMAIRNLNVGTNTTLTTGYNLYIANASGAGAVGTQYGIYLEDLTKGGTADYGIYIVGADTAAICVASADPIQLGVAGSSTGKMNIQGATSGIVTLTVNATAGTWTMTLPAAVGTAGYFLVDAAGNGITSWSKTLPASTIVAGSMFVAELANAAADVAAYGQFWVKSDAPNTPYFTDDTGVDREIVTADYAGIYHDNGGTLTINLVDNFELITQWDTDMPEAISNGDNTTDKITVGATGDYLVQFIISGTAGGTNKTYEFFAFELNASGEPIASTTAANPVVVSDVGHPFVNGNKIKITGVTTADELNDRIFTVTKLSADTYSLQDDEGVNIDGTGFGAGTGGTATLATQLDQVHSHRKFATADVGSLSGGGIVSLTKDKVVEVYVKNTTDATDIIIESGQFFLKRVD